MGEILRESFSGLPLWQKVLAAFALALYVACAIVYLILEKLSPGRTP
ncbi:hypothetical protein [Polaromonas sp. YR568]